MVMLDFVCHSSNTLALSSKADLLGEEVRMNCCCQVFPCSAKIGRCTYDIVTSSHLLEVLKRLREDEGSLELALCVSAWKYSKYSLVPVFLV
jgi:hypothetical protein